MQFNVILRTPHFGRGNTISVFWTPPTGQSKTLLSIFWDGHLSEIKILINIMDWFFGILLFRILHLHLRVWLIFTITIVSQMFCYILLTCWFAVRISHDQSSSSRDFIWIGFMAYQLLLVILCQILFILMY